MKWYNTLEIELYWCSAPNYHKYRIWQLYDEYFWTLTNCNNISVERRGYFPTLRQARADVRKHCKEYFKGLIYV